MTQSERHIYGMVQAIARRWYALQIGRLAAVTLVLLAAWLLAMVAIDNLAMLPPLGLQLGWSILTAGLTAWILGMCYRLTLGRPRREGLALMYEARVQGQRNRLINSILFLATGQAAHNPMTQAVIIENARHLDLATARQAVDFRAVRRALGLAVFFGVLLGAYWLMSPNWVANAMERLLNPSDPVPHLLAADFKVQPGDVQVVEGQSLAVRAEVHTLKPQYFPKAIELEYAVNGSGWKLAVMSSKKDSQFEYTLKNLFHPVAYRIRAGRTTSPVYHVAIRPRPRVEQLRITVVPPAYTGRPEQALPPGSGNVTALVGSTLMVDVTGSADLAQAYLELSDHTKVTLDVAAGQPRQCRGRLTVGANDSYSIHLTDKDGLTIGSPPQYSITAVPDDAPLASIPTPGRDLSLPADVSLDLGIEAEDDIGLGRIVLQVRDGTSDWKDTQQWELKQTNLQKHAVTAKLALADWKLKPNDVLMYRAVAYDRRAPEPNVGIGRTWSISITAPAKGDNLLLAQVKRLQESLQRILELQRQNRTEFTADAAIDPIRNRQGEIHEATLAAIDEQRKSPRPPQSILQPLLELANGQMLSAVQLLSKYEPASPAAAERKKSIVQVMDQIIAKLEELIGTIQRNVAEAEKAHDVLQNLSPEEREKALARIRDMLEKLRKFIPEQDQVISDTKEMVRKADNLTDEDLRKLERTKGTEDKWDKVLSGSVSDIAKLADQGFADRTIANDYKEMVEQIEDASKNLHPKFMEIAVPIEQAGRELAQKLAEDMEMWLPNSPDNIKWSMEEPLDHPEIPMPPLPDQLSDLVGDLIEEQDKLNDMADDVTSGWADAMSAAGWGVAGGPISDFSAKGKTGNQLPDKNEANGRSGDGRSGASQGQMMENTAKGLPGRTTPTRITNDPYEQGVVKELQKLAASGATGGGKARGSGQEGLQGESPPPLMDGLGFMQEWQKRIRQKAERLAGQLKVSSVSLPELDRSIGLMTDAEQAGQSGRYAEMFKVQQMVLQHLKATAEQTGRQTSVQVDRSARAQAEQRRKMLDAMDEPMPQEYQHAVQRYFQKLSETK